MTYELEFEDTFDGGALDPERWLPRYLPPWSNGERSAARYEVGGGLLRVDPRRCRVLRRLGEKDEPGSSYPKEFAVDYRLTP